MKNFIIFQYISGLQDYAKALISYYGKKEN